MKNLLKTPQHENKPAVSVRPYKLSPVSQKKLDEANAALAKLNEESLQLLGMGSEQATK